LLTLYEHCRFLLEKQFTESNEIVPVASVAGEAGRLQTEGCPNGEGRLIGEAEGKDNKAVNVDKLRQLSMNIHEDLQREEVISPAKGVLFGNGYRLQPIAEREAAFTEKCVSAALTSSTSLVATADLFRAAQYLAGPSHTTRHADPHWAVEIVEVGALVLIPAHRPGSLILDPPNLVSRCRSL
jgi:hypothetical protein